ncbi:MAG TPA: hypothetical protein ENJ95_16480 [Bacteroidetes bacterium]|nr:hypothetical protein [Bacteroidota bacterium]
MKTILLAILLAIAFLSCSSVYLSEKNSNDLTESSTDLIEIAPDFFVEASLADSYKTKKIHEVFQKLKAAKGDHRSHKPVLHLVRTTGKGIAVAYQLSGVIKLEEQGFDLCEEFGDDAENALAILLAHELVHIYEKHNWENLFAWEYSHTSLKNAVSNEKKKDEVQADYLGGVLAYQAGYEVYGIMPRFLDKVYKTYGLKDEEMANYPELKERKLMAVEGADKFGHFINYFEMANLLAVEEVYDDALVYYGQVLQDFQSREVYNNVGVVLVQSALKHFSPKQNRFAYPVELDAVSRMGKGGRGAERDSMLRERQLRDAIFYFENAQHLDPAYPIARLNKACANALLGVSDPATSQLEWEDANVSAKRAIQLSQNKPEWKATLSDGQVMLGILSALNGDREGALQYFDKALELEENHTLALANKNVLGAGESPLANSAGLDESGETIDGLPFSAIDFNKKRLLLQHRESPTDSLVLARLDFSGKNSFVLVHESLKGSADPFKQAYHVFHITGPGYEGETEKGISLENGDHASITKKYGPPQQQYPLGNGSLLRYEFKNLELIFQLGTDGRLLRWCVYRRLG